MFALTTALAAACGGDKMAPSSSSSTPELVSRVPAEDWARLSAMRIAFGHQSVGYDMLAGVDDIAKQVPAVRLTVVESNTVPAAPGIVHFRAGKNELPMTKVDDFVRFVDASGPSEPDIAMLKFCYIDANPNTNMRDVFTHYRDSLAGLRARHPQTTFVHLTMPLRTIQTGWKVSLKNLIGRPIGGHSEGAMRQEYNALLRTEYAGKEPVFDLAQIESTRADGSRVSFTKDGVTGYGLASEYTYDGGHLNEVGRRLVAERFLVLLADVAKTHAR
jgi:hypothetical protein